MPDSVLNRMARNREKLLGIVTTLDDDAFNQTHHDPEHGGTWSVRDILTHVLNAEEDHCRVAALIARGDLDRLPSDFDLDAHNAHRLAERGTLTRDELFAALDHQRQRSIDLYSGFSDEQRALSGPHPALGEISVSGIFKVIAMHDLLHLRDLQAILNPEN